MNLYEASRQWATRPADERFWNVEEMCAAMAAVRDRSTTTDIQLNRCYAVSQDDEVLLETKRGETIGLTHHAFGHLAQAASVPAAYARRIPPPLAALNVAHGLRVLDDDAKVGLLYQSRNGPMLRALTSERYERLWNADLGNWLRSLSAGGWRVPPAWDYGGDPRARAATAEDCIPGVSIVKPGDRIAPSALYASDHDMFCYLVQPERIIVGPGGRPLARGFFLRNDEVREASLRLTGFYFDFVCGNHNIFGAEGVFELRYRHFGHMLHKRIRDAQYEICKYVDRSAVADQELINRAAGKLIAAKHDDVIDLVAERGIFARKAAGEVMGEARGAEESHGDARSVWAYYSAATRLARMVQFTDERDEYERAAVKVLNFAR